jgi:hypothetical protein
MTIQQPKSRAKLLTILSLIVQINLAIALNAKHGDTRNLLNSKLNLTEKIFPYRENKYHERTVHKNSNQNKLKHFSAVTRLSYVQSTSTSTYLEYVILKKKDQHPNAYSYLINEEKEASKKSQPLRMTNKPYLRSQAMAAFGSSNTDKEAKSNNLTNQTLFWKEDQSENNVSLFLKIMATMFYSISFVLGLGGNALVLLVVIYFQRMRTVTNFFIFNLAISDLIFAVLCIPSTYITAYLIQYWPFSEFMCIFFNYMQNVSVTLTVYTLIWITLDKFWGLVKPLKQRISIKMCKLLICLSWLFSFFTSLPIAMFTRVDRGNQTNSFVNNSDENAAISGNAISSPTQYEVLPQCIEQWPNNLKSYTQIYNLLLFLIQYLVPLIILTFCYAKIGIVFRKAKAPGESIQTRDTRMIQSKKKVIFVLLVLLISYSICIYLFIIIIIIIIIITNFKDNKDVIHYGTDFHDILGANAIHNCIQILRLGNRSPLLFQRYIFYLSRVCRLAQLH